MSFFKRPWRYEGPHLRYRKMLIERHGVFWYEAYGYVRNKWLYIAATPNLERLRFSMWKAATRTDYPTDQAASVQLDFYGRLWFERTTP